MQQLLSIMIGGALGAGARYLLSNRVYEWLGREFPWGTLSVNVIGSFFIGLLTILLVERFPVDQVIRMGVIVGFLGAFTTFSTFSLDTLTLMQQGEHIRALLNILLSVVVCILAVWLGLLLGRQV